MRTYFVVIYICRSKLFIWCIHLLFIIKKMKMWHKINDKLFQLIEQIFFLYFYCCLGWTNKRCFLRFLWIDADKKVSHCIYLLCVVCVVMIEFMIFFFISYVIISVNCKIFPHQKTQKKTQALKNWTVNCVWMRHLKSLKIKDRFFFTFYIFLVKKHVIKNE